MPSLQVVPRHGHVPTIELARGQSSPASLFELRPLCHLLGEQRRLEPMENAFEPTDQLRLRDPELGIGRDFLGVERRRHPGQFGAQVRRKASLQLLQ